ncbi:MAG: serine/threonine-protein kinase, partial [Kofleriaceae bacterium]
MIAPGDILGGRYQVERMLGRGGMGLVVAARHLHLDQRVAIKLLLPEHIEQPLIVERFLREARASVRLRSDHVGRVLDAGRFEEGTPYLVMEYLEGHDLAVELRSVKQLPVAVAIDFILQACEALSEAHQLGIIHRDLKPANLFITRDQNGAAMIKVLDFGISKVVDDPASDLTRTKVVMGSPPYMSPEQLRASRDVDPRSDVWSLGVVLYQLVAGRLPFVGASLTDLALRISTDPPEPLGLAEPIGLESTIVRCFAKAPADRYASASELAVALAPFADFRSVPRIERLRKLLPEGAVDMSPTTLSGATGSMLNVEHRSRALVIGGVAAALVVVGIVVTFTMMSGSGKRTSDARPATAVEPTPPAAVAPPPVMPDAMEAKPVEVAAISRIPASRSPRVRPVSKASGATMTIVSTSPAVVTRFDSSGSRAR